MSRRVRFVGIMAGLSALWLGVALAVVARGDETASEPQARRSLAYRSKDLPALTVRDLPRRRFDVFDVHEHVLDLEQAERLLVEMDALRIRRTCLMGTSRYSFTLDPRDGFERYLQHNESLLEIERAHPRRFCTFVTLNPLDAGNLERLRDYVRRGADGLKLYLGHGGETGKAPFHVMPVDDPRMMPIYAWAERVQLPVMLHVNLIKYHDEFVRVMDAYPRLRVCIPHFGLHKNTEKRLARLGELLDRYPNLYTDIGFGWHTFHTSGFEALARWRTRSRNFLARYADKIMFSTDMVIEPSKDELYIRDTLRSYMQLLEMESFRYFRHPELPMHGLNLPSQVLQKIYEDTPARFLSSETDGRLPERKIAPP